MLNIRSTGVVPVEDVAVAWMQFGRTINIAARVQGLSGGNEIMISNNRYEEHGINQLIESYNWKKKEIKATLN